MKPTLIAIFGFGLLSAFVGLNNVAVAIMMTTLGFGFPLIYAATPIPYLIALLPLFVGDGFILARCVVTAVALLLVSAAPNWFAMQELLRLNRDLPPPLVAPPAKVPRTLEIENSVHQWCDEVCVAILQTGQLAWLRLQPLKDAGGHSVVYKPGDGKNCVFYPGPANSFCVTKQPDSGESAELKIEFTSELGPLLSETMQYLFEQVRRVHIRGILNSEGEGKVIFDKTTVEGQMVGVPTLISVKFFGMSSHGFTLAKNVEIHSERDVIDALKSIGYNLR
jgi:hypothetical protein